MAFSRDEKVIFFNDKRKFSLELPEQAIDMSMNESTCNFPELCICSSSFGLFINLNMIFLTGFDDPYLVSVLPNSVIVQSQSPKLDIQKIDLEKPKYIAKTVSSKYVLIHLIF